MCINLLIYTNKGQQLMQPHLSSKLFACQVQMIRSTHEGPIKLICMRGYAKETSQLMVSKAQRNSRDWTWFVATYGF